MKLSFEPETIPRCFWWNRLEMSLSLNLIGEYNKLFKLGFREKITSLVCLLGSRLNNIFHWKPITYLLKVGIKFTYWFIFAINLWKKRCIICKHNEFIPSGRSYLRVLKTKVTLVLRHLNIQNNSLFSTLKIVFE